MIFQTVNSPKIIRLIRFVLFYYMGVYFFLHICTGRFSWWGCDAVRYGNRGKVSKLCCLDGRDLEKDFFTIIFSMRLSLCTDFEEYKII